MSTLGTFDSFSTARLGIYAAQQGLQVTGNNISNINTAGYTRQRLDQVSFKAGAYDRYRSQLDNHSGTGALVMNINQIRDPYLDVRYRNISADVGYHDTYLSGLDHIASILDETGVGDDTNVNKKGDGRLQAQIQAVSDALRKYSKEPTKLNNDLVRRAADTLCGIFNSYATQLENYRKETVEDFEDQVTKVNEILLNIRDLNDEIRDNEIFGDNALELRDERNRQIDELSELIHIKVTYGEEDVGAGRKVEKLTIVLDNDNPDSKVHSDESMLVDGVYATQLRYPEKLPKQNPLYDPTTKDTAAVEAFRYIKPDGGFTNDITEADTYDNTNYTLQLDKLRDELDKEWVKNSTKWEEVDGGVIGKKAIYETKIEASTGWAADDTFEVNGTTYTIGKDIPVNDMNNPAALAKFIAGKLNENNDDYTVTALSDGTIRFTAKAVGAVGGNGPAAAPTFNVGSLTPNAQVTPAAPEEKQEGVDEVSPAGQGDPPNPAAGTTVNADGSETIISYQVNNGKWWKITTVKEHTFEVTLDDNDLHGSLQATRELLTEKGEFSTAEDVAIDEDATIKRGIPYYQKALDLMAYQFATEYNKLNQGQAVDQNGDPISGEQTVNAKKYNVVDGKVYALGDGQGLPIKNDDYKLLNGWSLQDNKYFVDDSGNYVGKHGDDCDINGLIKANGTPQEKLKGLLDSGWLTQDQYNTIDAKTGTDKEAAIQEALDACLSQHGAAPGDTVIITDIVPTELGGILFSNRGDRDWTGSPDDQPDDPDNPNNPRINASNISVSFSWSNGDVELVPKYEVLWNGDLEHSTQNTNADHMVTMIDPANNILFNPKDIDPDAVSDKLFYGSFNGLYNDICTTLGEDQKKHTVAVNMYYTQRVEIDTAREGVSGVDLNDEAMNLIQYQKAYSAACRLMTVIDEALDRLINNTGIAGR